MFICASRDTIASTYGFTGWRWDEDQYLRPLTDRILVTSPSPIKDFTFVTSSKFLDLYNQIFSSRSNDDQTKHFPILTWCRDDQLRLIDMDSTFRQTWRDYKRAKLRYSTDSSNLTIISKSSSSSRLPPPQQQFNRNSTNKMTMDVIEDETTDAGESDLDDNAFPDISLPRIDSIESPETGDDNDMSVT